MFSDLRRRHHWVLEPYQYESEETLLANLAKRVIAVYQRIPHRAPEMRWPSHGDFLAAQSLELLRVAFR